MDVDLLHYQHEFITSNSKKAFLLGGIGSGKTHTIPHFILRMLKEYPNTPGILTANTFTQLYNATVETIKAEFDFLNIPYHCVLSGAQKRIELFGIKIFLYSLEKHDNIRGPNVGWWLSDETAYAKKEAVQVVRGRIRDRNGPLFERHSSSANGYNWAFEEFENKDKENKNDRHHLIRAKTKENIFLADGYYESLLEDYGGEKNPLAQQELMGQFVNLLGGEIYWGFSRERNIFPVKLNDNYPVYVGQDFNIDNMNNCYVQFIGGKFFVASETILEHYDANTDTAALRIVKDLAEYHPIVIPDSTGKARKTSASGRTDIEILKSHGLEVLQTRNPLIRDRQNTLNIHFRKGDVIIDPSCIKLIKEIETLSSRDKEGDTAHVSVGLGYVTNKLKPLQIKKRSTSRGGVQKDGIERFYQNDSSIYSGQSR